MSLEGNWVLSISMKSCLTSGCYNENAIDCGLNNKLISQGWESKIKVLADSDRTVSDRIWCLVRPQCLVHRLALLCPHMAEGRAGELPEVSYV